MSFEAINSKRSKAKGHRPSAAARFAGAVFKGPLFLKGVAI
tara:strand:+ start:1558 stop:1680 length:123 start_codon:yes stop_codon:yes gene_type:complete